VRADAREVISARNGVRSSRIFDPSPQLGLTAGQRISQEKTTMRRTLPRSILVGLAFVVATTASVARAETFQFADVVGWWSAEPEYGGESSRVVLHFLEDNGKQAVRISLLAIGGYEVPIGTVAIDGMTLDMQPYPFPLRFDPKAGTLSGYLAEEAVPVYKIPVEFHRIEPLAKPAPRTWEFPRPHVRWTFDTGAAVWAGLEHDAASGLTFVANDAGTLYALDAKGAERWKFATGKSIKARPTVIGDFVYLASDSGFLYKLDKRSGAESWRAQIDTGSPARIPAYTEGTRWDRYGSSVVADSKRVYVASRDKSLYALDLATGKEQWRVQTEDLMTATPALYRDLVLFADYKGVVQAVGASDGKPRWSYDARLPVAGDLVVDADRVFVGSRTYDLIALDAASGKELWKHYYWFSWIESPPVVRDGVVYTGSSDGVGVFAIDARDGKLRWKAAVPGWAWPRTAVGKQLVVAATVGAGAYPGNRAGSLVAIDRASGAIRWMYLDPPSKETVEKKAEWGFGAAPAMSDGVVYAADLQGRVHAIECERQACSS
jgi:outer membrane protein assembly factor BamB